MHGRMLLDVVCERPGMEPWNQHAASPFVLVARPTHLLHLMIVNFPKTEQIYQKVRISTRVVHLLLETLLP